MSTAQSLFCRLYSAHYPGDKTTASPVFSIVTGATIVLSATVLSGFRFTCAPMTTVLGMLNGLVLIGYNYSMVGASGKGAYSIQMVFMLSGGILIPAVINCLSFGNRHSAAYWMMLAAIIVSIFLVSYKKGEQSIKQKLFWLFCIGTFIFNGLYGALLNIQQEVTRSGDKEMMLIITYSVSLLISAGLLLVSRRKNFLKDFRQTPKSGLFLIISALSTAIATNLIVHAISLIDVSVLYTFDNAGVLLISTFSSCILFKEKLSTLNIIGCAIISICLVGVAIF